VSYYESWIFEQINGVPDTTKWPIINFIIAVFSLAVIVGLILVLVKIKIDKAYFNIEDV
jgi:hypothetical protein